MPIRRQVAPGPQSPASIWRGVPLLLAVLAAGGVAAQSPLAPPALPPVLPGGAPLPTLPAGSQAEILQRILDAGAGRPGPTPTLAQPTPSAAASAPLPPSEPLSPAEAFFAAREIVAGPPLRAFGYDNLLPGPAGASPGPSYGALPDDYRVGPDDEVIVTLRGRARATHAVRISRDGLLLLPEFGPVAAAGRPLAALRAELEARAQAELGGSEVFVSIGQLRQIGVFVGGEVIRPGLQPLTPLASVLEALVAAGGVRRTGSLRAIRVEGPAGRRTIDLYPVIAGEGAAPDLTLREGSRILVPPLGGVVAVGGEVARPGIYELPAGAAAAPLAAVLRLAGDPLRPAGNRFLLQTTDAEGRRTWREVAERDTVRRGDALRVEPQADVLGGGLRLAGHVAGPVTRALAGAGRGGRGGSAGTATLRGLLADPRLVRADPYARLGVIWRTDARGRTRRFLAFDLGRVLGGETDLPLAEGDEVILPAQADVQWLASPGVQAAIRGDAADAPPGVAPSPADCPALAQLAIAAGTSRLRFAHARMGGGDGPRVPCPALFVEYPTLLPFLLDQAALVAGEVRLPGLYPVAGETPLELVLAAAGGTQDTADLSGVEVAREPALGNEAMVLLRTTVDLRDAGVGTTRIGPRDTVRVPRSLGDRDLGPVSLLGEFVRPGSYAIRRGERLSEVIARAGGLTPQAYAYGAVFTRDSVRARQQEGFARTARELEQGLVQVATGQAVSGGTGRGVDVAGAVSAGRELAAALRVARAAGRMVIEANPVVLAARPDLDVLLEPGDLLVVPKRPNEVTVVGAVLNPGSLQHAGDWRPADYVRAAGGEQRYSDSGRAFVVLPDGRAVPAGLRFWQRDGPPVPPGSLVVVPQDPAPYQGWAFLRDATAILGQVALSGAALAVISRSDQR